MLSHAPFPLAIASTNENRESGSFCRQDNKSTHWPRYVWGNLISLLAQPAGFRQYRGFPVGEAQHINNLKLSLFCLRFQKQTFLFVSLGRNHSDGTYFWLPAAGGRFPEWLKACLEYGSYWDAARPPWALWWTFSIFYGWRASFMSEKELRQLGHRLLAASILPIAESTESPRFVNPPLLFYSWGEVCESVWKRNLCCLSCHGSQSVHLEFDFWQSKVCYPSYTYWRAALTSPSCGWEAQDCIFFLRHKGRAIL